uniref:Hypothetical p138 protein n=1 Tax=Trypanosoma cruzi TaxID=5693 RepID=Q26939_TRYCR|nr:hypothetical p138 protein [Trypanosoma cruzi]
MQLLKIPRGVRAVADKANHHCAAQRNVVQPLKRGMTRTKPGRVSGDAAVGGCVSDRGMTTTPQLAGVMTSVVLKDKSSVGKTATMEAKKATEGLALGILDTARGMRRRRRRRKLYSYRRSVRTPRRCRMTFPKQCRK